MTILEKQQAFARLIVELIKEAYRMGYALTLGETYRPPETALLYAKSGKGIGNSLHTKRLALDVNLFIKGVYQTKSETYRKLGEYWESLSTPDLICKWGGRWVKPDGNHFSIEHNGVS